MNLFDYITLLAVPYLTWYLFSLNNKYKKTGEVEFGWVVFISISLGLYYQTLSKIIASWFV